MITYEEFLALLAMCHVERDQVTKTFFETKLITVFRFHPAFNPAKREEQIKALFDTFGMQAFRILIEMLPTAKTIQGMQDQEAKIEEELENIYTEINALQYKTQELTNRAKSKEEQRRTVQYWMNKREEFIMETEFQNANCPACNCQG